jgi:hypothetical protein
MGKRESLKYLINRLNPKKTNYQSHVNGKIDFYIILVKLQTKGIVLSKHMVEVVIFFGIMGCILFSEWVVKYCAERFVMN